MEAIRLQGQPKLRKPIMVAAWPGMGGVATVAAKYLMEKLGAQEFGSIDPEEFFDLSGVLIEDSMVKDIEFPECKFYVWESGGKNDLIIFIGEAQPLMKGYAFANMVIDVAQRFKVKRLYTFAAAPTHIYHTKRPKVLAVATKPKLIEELKGYDVTLLSQGTISGLNGLLLAAAKAKKIDGICLLSEIPIYTTQIANPRSSKAVLQVFGQMSGLEIDLGDLDNWARETDEEIDGRLDHMRRTFGEEARELIEYFDRLAEQTSAEEMSEYRTDELLKEIERFLRGKSQEKGGN